MLQYLIILLSDDSTSFCHYPVPTTSTGLMPIETLRQGIRFGMMENMMIQFIYPAKPLPEAYQSLIETTDHYKIVPQETADELTDIVVVSGWSFEKAISLGKSTTLRTTKDDLFTHYTLLPTLLQAVPNVNVVITDMETFTDKDFATYRKVTNSLAETLKVMIINGQKPNLNLLTDRMALQQMNNCNAGQASITLAPNGHLYICPAFYYDNPSQHVGEPHSNSIHIVNQQLYGISHAPICNHCDAFQCKRCVWLNKKITLEVNTPSHEQCVVAHIERNTSARLLTAIRQHATFLPEQEDIMETTFLDPFDNRDKWQQEN